MRKRASTKGKIIIAALLICLSASYFYSWKDDVMRKFVYPLQYDYLVRQYAYEDKVDPALVASVILVESKFDERAASQPGAHGLMQVMPDTAQWIADEMGMTDYTPDGNQVLALAAYNAGRGHVDSWIQKYGWTKNFQEIEKIPFSETREYVRIVLLNEKHYKQLYDF